MSNYPPVQNQGFPPNQYYGGHERSNFQPPPKSKKTRTCLIVVLAVGGAVILFCGLGVAAVYFGVKKLPVAERDRAVVLDFKKLEPYVADVQFNPDHEKFTKVRYLDGSHELEYEYETPVDEGIFLTCSVSVEKSISDAQTSYSAYSAGTNLGASFAGGSLEDESWNFRWGDQSRLVAVKSPMGYGGNVFVSRKGTRVFYFGVAGVYLDDPESIRALLMPVLNELETYEP